QGRYKAGRVSNIYLGPEERSYIAMLHQFSERLDSNVRIVPIVISKPESARAYGLASSTLAALYVHHFANHSLSVQSLQLKVEVPALSRVRYQWIRPATEGTLAEGPIRTGQETFVAPPFSIDISLLISNAPNQR